MAKKSGGLKSKANASKRNKSKKGGMFIALKKRIGVVESEKSDPHSSKRKAKVAKRPAPVRTDYRNFDERIAAKKARRPGFNFKASAVASPTFKLAAPTFKFNAKSVQPTAAPREVEGFHGFISALEAPTDAPIGTSNQNNGDEEQMRAQTALPAAPAFMQPATFTFATLKPALPLQSSFQSSLESSLQQSLQSAVVEIDSDL